MRPGPKYDERDIIVTSPQSSVYPQTTLLHKNKKIRCDFHSKCIQFIAASDHKTGRKYYLLLGHFPYEQVILAA
jgi:hypothetical protein